MKCDRTLFVRSSPGQDGVGISRRRVRARRGRLVWSSLRLGRVRSDHRALTIYRNRMFSVCVQRTPPLGLQRAEFGRGISVWASKRQRLETTDPAPTHHKDCATGRSRPEPVFRLLDRDIRLGSRELLPRTDWLEIPDSGQGMERLPPCLF
jgi:hypothetical protein